MQKIKIDALRQGEGTMHKIKQWEVVDQIATFAGLSFLLKDDHPNTSQAIRSILKELNLENLTYPDPKAPTQK